MADFKKGQLFLDKSAINIQGIKGKYFIAMSDAEDDDDLIICFVLNTERRMEKYHLNCNKNFQRFIIPPDTFSFIHEYTSIMLVKEVFYKFAEIFENNILLLDMTNEILLRQIKNGIDWNYISPKAKNIILKSFKN